MCNTGLSILSTFVCLPLGCVAMICSMLGRTADWGANWAEAAYRNRLAYHWAMVGIFIGIVLLFIYGVLIQVAAVIPAKAKN